MNTLKFTCYLYENTKTIPHKEAADIVNSFKAKGIKVIGSLTGCHIGVKPIIFNKVDSYMKNINKIVIEKVKKVFVYVERVGLEYKWHYIADKTNLLFDYMMKSDNLVKYDGQVLETLSNNAHLLKKEAMWAFEQANVHVGDVVIENTSNNEYEYVEYGILHYYEHDCKQHALVPSEKFDENNLWKIMAEGQDVSLCDVVLIDENTDVIVDVN